MTTIEDTEVRDLVGRAMKLPLSLRESIAHELLDSIEDERDTIARRAEEIESGKSIPLSREEAEVEVRDRLRTLGVEL